MSKPHQIHLLDVISATNDVYGAIFFTYGADLCFFEDAILKSLWHNGCRNIAVVMDAARYSDTIRDFAGTLTGAGVHYLPLPVRLRPPYSFHAKMILLVGERVGRLLIGSGNLTFTGYGHNLETYSCVEWSPDESEYQSIFQNAWQLIHAITQQWVQSPEVRHILAKMARVARWLDVNIEPGDNDLKLLHTIHQPLIDQCANALSGEEIEKLTIVTPFLDDGAVALQKLIQRFDVAEVHLILQNGKASGNVKSLQDLKQSGFPLRVSYIGQSDRYLHAKIYVFRTSTAAYVLTGSANCTRAAWLASPPHGNVEIALLRRGVATNQFDYLLEQFHLEEDDASLTHLVLRQMPTIAENGVGAAATLLDISFQNQEILVHFESDNAVDVSLLRLSLLIMPPTYYTMEISESGSTHMGIVRLGPQLAHLLNKPVAATLCSIGAEGYVDLGCNKLWITNADLLHNSARRTSLGLVRSGDFLSQMFVETESEWQDLYQTLTRLLTLDVHVAQTSQSNRSTVGENESTNKKHHSFEPETRIRLVDDGGDEGEKNTDETVDIEIFREGEFHAFLEYVLATLPGNERRGTAILFREQPTSIDPHPRRRWTPAEHTTRRFLHLVRKYIGSLANPDYMRTTPVLGLLGHYVVFQRIVWLLLQHTVINETKYVDLVSQINTGFFGSLQDEPLLTKQEMSRHLGSTKHMEWEDYEVASHALLSLVLSHQCLPRVKDDEIKAQAYAQTLPVLCSIGYVSQLDELMQHNSLAQLAADFDQDMESIIYVAKSLIHGSLSGINALLTEWITTLNPSLVETENQQRKHYLSRLRVEFMTIQHAIAVLRRDMDAQRALCSELAVWTAGISDIDMSLNWYERLLELLSGQSEKYVLTKTLYEFGLKLGTRGRYADAVSALQQARSLAVELNDSDLLHNCDLYLRWYESK